MTRVLFVGQKPETVDYSDPSLPPGFDAEKIQAGIDIAEATMKERGWQGDLCMIAPDDNGIAMLAAQLAKVTYKPSPCGTRRGSPRARGLPLGSAIGSRGRL